MTPAFAVDGPPAPRAAGRLPPVVQRPPVDLTFLKRLVWLYLALWIVEGALRKWILPGLATPLLIVRDPVLLLMYAVALQKGVFPRGAFMVWTAGISAAALAFSMIGTKAPLAVQMYGFRSDFLHLPLIFLLPMILDRDDLRRVGKWTLLVALPMSFLVLLQFRGGSGSRLNVGAGGEGTMLDAAYNHIRPSGTFSFSNGLGNFTGIVAAFCIYQVLAKGVYPRLLWLASVPALAGMIILSGSRSAVGLVLVVLSTVLVISLVRPRYFAAALKLAGVCGLGALVAGSVAVFRDGLQVFAYRFGDTQDVQSGFIDRFFSAFLAPFELFNVVDFYGVGLGMGTNVGAGLIYDKRKFLYSEGELGRVMFESGPVIGSAFLLLRVAIVLFLLSQALRTLRREGQPLPMLLLGACGIEMVLGQFGQATTLGFTTIMCGLCLAANNAGASELDTADAAALAARARPPPPAPPRAGEMPGGGSTPARAMSAPPGAPDPGPPVAPARGLPRGRSLYAEQMQREAQERGAQNREPGSAEAAINKTEPGNEPPQ